MEILICVFVIIIVIWIIGVILSAIASFFKFIFQIICDICELVCELISIIVDLIVKHITLILKVLSTAFVIFLLVIYICEAEEPFAFLLDAWNFVMIGHDIPGIIVGSFAIMFLSMLCTKVGKYLKNKYLKIINMCMFLTSMVLAIVQSLSVEFCICYFICFLCFEGYKKELRIVFGKEEVSHTIPIKYICFSWNYVSLWCFVAALKVPAEVWNRYYDTAIQLENLFIVIAMLVILLLCIGKIIVLKGYMQVRHTVKKLGIFDYCEVVVSFKNKYEHEYVIDILDNMESFLVKSAINKKEWMTKKYLLFWKKQLQQGKRMKEIEDSYNYSLHNQTFRELYMKMYCFFHGVSLEFPKMFEETDVYYKNAPMFRVFRYKILDHPVSKEKGKIANKYILSRHYFVRLFYREYSENTKALEPEFMQLRWLEGLCCTKEQKKQLKKMIKKQNYWNKLLKSRNGDYSFLLILEVLYFVKNYAHNIDKGFLFENIEELAKKMGLSQQKNVFLYRFFAHGIYKFDRDRLIEVRDEYSTRFRDNLPDYFVKQLMENKEYEEREETHIAICATVSSGKSTFLNTILGKGLMPNRMTACTARMGVIRTNDCLIKPISVIENKSKNCIYESNITSKKMDELNMDEQVKQVLTEISVPLLKKANKILYFHDSPGVNNSMDETHHEVTLNYLKTEKPEWILFLIDAQHDTVNDNVNLLKEIAEYAQKKSNVIFLYNKVDCLKEEDGDDLDENLNEVREMIRQQGFSSPRIFPISAKAAQLFSEVLVEQHQNFTDADKRLFLECYKFFKKKKNNMMRYFEEEVSAMRNIEYEKLDREQIVIVKDKEYIKGDILDAWYRTGVYALVEWILQYIAGKEENV